MKLFFSLFFIVFSYEANALVSPVRDYVFKSGPSATHYRLGGDPSRPLILLVSGFFVPAKDTWQNIEVDLIQRGYQTLSFDLWGRGQSSLSPAGYGVSDYTAQTQSLLLHLNKTPQSVMSFSMGVVFACDWINHFGASTTQLTAISPVALDQKLWAQFANMIDIPDWLINEPEVLQSTLYFSQMIPSFSVAFLAKSNFWNEIKTYFEKKGVGAALIQTLKSLDLKQNRNAFELSLNRNLTIHVLRPEFDAFDNDEYLFQKQLEYSNLKIQVIKNGLHGFLIENPESASELIK